MTRSSMLGFCAVLAASGLIAGAPGRADQKAADALAGLERKLHGEWAGTGPCDGRLTLKADGTYHRRLHGPAGNNSSGTWRLRWDQLPPVLALSCTRSDDPSKAGRTDEVKVVRLDGRELALQHAEQRPTRFRRDEGRGARD